MIQVKETWNGDDLIRAMQESVHEAGLKTVKHMVDIAQSVFVPVLTGKLRGSLQLLKNEPTAWSFGSEVRYALWVEIGAQGRRARRYLAQAAESQKHLFFMFLRQELASRGW